MNNKMIKGSVAGATGIVLLMGGFGTYALWSDSVSDLDGGALNSGELHINRATSNGTAWYNGDDTTDPEILDINDFRMVPGDTVTLVQKLDVDAVGSNLNAELEVTGVTNDFKDLLINVEYANKNADFNSPWTTVPTIKLDYGPSDMSALDGATEAIVTFALPAQPTTVDMDDENKVVDLGDVGVTLRQVFPTTP